MIERRNVCIFFVFLKVMNLGAYVDGMFDVCMG